MQFRLSAFWFLTMALMTEYSHAQKNDNSLYAVFDKTVQSKNSGLNNGKVFFNKHRSFDTTHRFFGTDVYVAGDVFFDGQSYPNVSLKYDLLNDDLIVKLDGGGNQMGFIAVKEKIHSFYMGGKKFVNLDLNPAHPDFIRGFYEETITGGGLTLYTKYNKDRFEVLSNENVFNKYVDKNAFAVNYQNEWFEFNSERDAVRVFPNLENKITLFFKENISLEKANKKQFTKNLAAFINNLLTAETK